jgi:hypothetical protein
MQWIFCAAAGSTASVPIPGSSLANARLGHATFALKRHFIGVGVRMLAELETFHADLLRLIGELERLTQDASPRMDAIADVRLKLTRVSRRRSEFLESMVYPHVLAMAASTSHAQITELRIQGIESRMRSTSHISQWTLIQVQENWSEYREASETMRASMRKRIRQEQEALYPILRAAEQKRG